jgi:tRNA threonylcarbamoyladenosine biosynthesis protein TsaB
MSNDNFILALETSGRYGSVAAAQGANLLAEKPFSDKMRHSAEVFPVMQEFLEQFDKTPADVAEIYISSGPGSFTGLRIAVTIAKIMHLTLGCKIVAVDSLDVVAQNACETDRVGVIVDAKRGQFFCAAYERYNSSWNKVLEDNILSPAEFLDQVAKPITLIGEGLVYYKGRFVADQVTFADEELWRPRASGVHKIGYERALRNEYTDVAKLLPNYIRRPDAKVKKI